MLRILMLDLRTMKEDKFEATMRDYFQTYKGRAASTDDFRRIAEKHAGASPRLVLRSVAHHDRDPRVSGGMDCRSGRGEGSTWSSSG